MDLKEIFAKALAESLANGLREMKDQTEDPHQKALETIEKNRMFWSKIKYKEVGDDPLRVMVQNIMRANQALFTSEALFEHMETDEDMQPQNESRLRCKFWNSLHKLDASATLYAEFLGCIEPLDVKELMREEEAITAKYAAMKTKQAEE